MGTPRPGARLRARSGTWSALRAEFACRWRRSGNGRKWLDFAGANHCIYTPARRDAGAVLRVIVTTTNPDGVKAASATQGVPPVAKTRDGGHAQLHLTALPGERTSITAGRAPVATEPTCTLTAASSS